MTEDRALVSDLRQQLSTLETDLHRQAQETPSQELNAAWQTARMMGRSAADRERWLDERVTQSASAWMLATTFARYCEDNRLIDAPFLAGPGDRLDLARDRQRAFFRQHPDRTDRDWIVGALDALSVSATTLRLFDDLHGLMRQLPLSPKAARDLIAFWRRVDGDGQPIHDFTDPALGTGFLGGVYANLSEDAKKAYALVETPEFVADLILDRTVVPAIDAFGLKGLRIIDPVCGSGTFLLGTFRRLLEAWQEAEPGTDPWIPINRTLTSLHGVDKNPIAVVISRFRMLITVMAATGTHRLAEVPELPLTIGSADSLIPSDRAGALWKHEHDEHLKVYLDPVTNLLGTGSYDAVVGNPPYTTVRDPSENELYRDIYRTCRGKYALTIPFIERFFRLARSSNERAGFVGLIASNSFMKREFGRPLIEEFLSAVDLTHVLDTSGAYIPGHGTPTVVLLGRARPSERQSVRVALGVRGEPVQPSNPATGAVWQALVSQIDDPGSESEWIFVEDIDRNRLAKHPWSLAGSSADKLLDALVADVRLSNVTSRIGYYATTGSDDLFTASPRVFQRFRAEGEPIVTVITGSEVRDWAATPQANAFFPGTDPEHAIDISLFPHHMRRLWPYRTTLRIRPLDRARYSPMDRLAWYSWHQVTTTPGAHPWSLTFSWVATHAHFAVLRGDAAALQSAPVIKLPGSAGEDDFFGLAAVLNSSIACFWLKQYSQSKGAPRSDQLRAEEPWERFYEFTSTCLRELPLPHQLPADRGRELDELAQRLSEMDPVGLRASNVPTRSCHDAARAEHDRILGRMIALQEELDWDVYRRYGLLTDDEAAELIVEPEFVPELKLGERAFEIVLARGMAKGELETQWFARHRSEPITEIPAHWPREYRDVVAKRVEMIERDRNIGLIERPECKRRWQSEPWANKERDALTTWLLDRCEERALWFGPDGNPRPMTVNRLADQLRADADVVSVARLLAGPDADLADIIADITADEHVPYLSQLRYTGEGLLKREQWERTWDLQRAEDRTDRRLDIPAPPRYKNTDFRKISYWRQRGKFDVPKERFISYPMASPDSDDSLLLGWAGWDHCEQAHALITVLEERSTAEGWDIDRLTPMLAGLAEVMPWVQQWHGEVDERFGTSVPEAYATYLTATREKYGLAEEDVRNWSAPPVRRGRPPKAPAAGIRNREAKRR